MKRGLIIGCGYAGRRLGARLLGMDFEGAGTTRSEERAAELEELGIAPLVGELSDRELLRRIDKLGPQLIGYFAPPELEGGDSLRRVLDATARAPLEAFLYASSTSVYGDRGGDWVDETTMVRPESATAEARHAAERAIIESAWSYQTPTRICRITGIYGPGRTLRPMLENGEYVLIEGRDPWVNRIHVDDLVTAMLAAWERGSDGRVYNMTDDEPHRASEFAMLAAELHGLAAPERLSEAAGAERLGEERLSRKTGSKRVRNDRQRKDLEVELEYPSFRSGLPAAVAEEVL
jgi:nucleoside-diphosphate-sugar epimerase